MLFMESLVSKVHCSVSTLSRTKPSACKLVLTPTVLKQGLRGLRQNLRRQYRASQWVINFTVMCKSRIIIQTSNTRRFMSVAPICVQYYCSLLLHPSTINSGPSWYKMSPCLWDSVGFQSTAVPCNNSSNNISICVRLTTTNKIGLPKDEAEFQGLLT